MKKLLLTVSLGLLGWFVALPPARAAEAAPKPADKSPAAPFAGAVTTVTGIAISPLVGTGAYGAYQWLTAPGDTVEAKAASRAALPWFAQFKFWFPALLLAGAVAAKDTLGTILPPGTKKPLDVLETVENKISGAVAAGAVVPITMNSLSHMVLGAQPAAEHIAGLPSGLAMVPLASADWSWLLNILTVPFGLAVFGVVWMASHAINVLILLSPWGAVDAALKSARTAVLGLLAVTASVSPWTGALLSLVVILFAWLVAGWSFRLTVFGTLFSWEFFTGKSGRFTPAETGGNAMFSSGALPGVPVRTYGQLARQADGSLQFTYRPWLVLAPKTATVPASARLAVGQGLFFSTVLGENGGTFFILPPRYRGHEARLAQICQFPGGVQPAGLRKAWSALRELLTGGPATKAA